MRLSINTSGKGCPAGQPIALIDLDTGQLFGCYASISDATHHRGLIMAGERGFDDDEPVRSNPVNVSLTSRHVVVPISPAGYCPLCGNEHRGADDSNYCAVPAGPSFNNN